MNIKYIVAAIAAMAAQSSFALTVADTATAQTAGRVIYLSGASALRASVAGAVQQLCASGYTEYRLSANASNVRAFSCTLKASGTGAGQLGITHPWGGQNVVVHMNTVGGSLTSVLGMSTAATLASVGHVKPIFIDWAAGCPTATTCAGSAARPNGEPGSHGGFSDVEGALFSDVLGTAAQSGLEGGLASLSGVNKVNVPAAQSFGIAVSLPLYRALQTKQSLTGTCQDGGADDFAAACQPSVTKSEYASAIAAQNGAFISDWSLIGLSNAEQMYICRRPVTSGTQASSNAFFLGKNCTAGAVEPSAQADTAPGSYTVVENSGTGDVISCLDTGNTAAAGSKFRWGVVSAENEPAANWQFVKLDGVSINESASDKNRQSLIDQKYDFAFEFVLHTSKSTTVTPVNQRNLMNRIAALLGNPVVTDLNGIAVLPNGSYTNAGEPTQVSKASRSGNSCSPFLTVL